jgi:hypothetical protein
MANQNGVKLYPVSQRMVHDAEMLRTRLLAQHMYGSDNPELEALNDALCAAQYGRVTGKQYGVLKRAAAQYAAHRDRVNAMHGGTILRPI